MPSTKIRPATKEDMQAVHDMVRELALFERAEDKVVTSSADLIRDGFADRPLFDILIAETDNDELAGFALYYPTYSTWNGASLYLEDLYVREKFRGLGIGGELFKAVIKSGVQKGAAVMRWQVLDWNKSALNFYKKYQAELDSEWINGMLKLSAE